MKVWQCPICRHYHGSRQDTELCFAECLDGVEAKFQCQYCEQVFESSFDCRKCENKHEVEWEEERKEQEMDRLASSGCEFGVF